MEETTVLKEAASVSHASAADKTSNNSANVSNHIRLSTDRPAKKAKTVDFLMEGSLPPLTNTRECLLVIPKVAYDNLVSENLLLKEDKILVPKSEYERMKREIENRDCLIKAMLEKEGISSSGDFNVKTLEDAHQLFTTEDWSKARKQQQEIMYQKARGSVLIQFLEAIGFLCKEEEQGSVQEK